MKISNVSVTINEQSQSYGSTKNEEKSPPSYNLQASITSDDRDFLERVAKAVHRELANPEAAAMKPDAFLNYPPGARGESGSEPIGRTFTPGMGS